MNIDNLISEYEKIKTDIKKRLKEFKSNLNKSEKELFAELCFCVCTPQAKATQCDLAIKRLKKNNILYTGSINDIKKNISGVRFPNNKSKYILDNRNFLSKNNSINIKQYIDIDDVYKTREWLVKNIKGFGYKEAGHFLRNIGLGKDIAILDTHIIKNLIKFKVIKEKPKTLTKKEYLNIENKFKKFAKKINIPLDELDLLFWSFETGFIFK